MAKRDIIDVGAAKDMRGLGLTFQEIADHFGVTRQAVHNRLIDKPRKPGKYRYSYKPKDNPGVQAPCHGQSDMAAHHLVAIAIKKGLIISEACEVCCKGDAHAHHDDYNKPLDVRWLCIPHHKEWHKKNEAIPRSGLAEELRKNAVEAWMYLEPLAKRFRKKWRVVVCAEIGVSYHTVLRWEQGKIRLKETWKRELTKLAGADLVPTPGVAEKQEG